MIVVESWRYLTWTVLRLSSASLFQYILWNCFNSAHENCEREESEVHWVFLKANFKDLLYTSKHLVHNIPWSNMACFYFKLIQYLTRKVTHFLYHFVDYSVKVIAYHWKNPALCKCLILLSTESFRMLWYRYIIICATTFSSVKWSNSASSRFAVNSIESSQCISGIWRWWIFVYHLWYLLDSLHISQTSCIVVVNHFLRVYFLSWNLWTYWRTEMMYAVWPHLTDIFPTTPNYVHSPSSSLIESCRQTDGHFIFPRFSCWIMKVT